MDFEYTASIYIESNDLREMYKRVKNGEDFNTVFTAIMAGYDDEVYYASDYVREDVHKEILRRLNQSLT